MMNFRELFNVKYGYIGIAVILILFFIIFIINKDIKKGFKNIGIIFIISSIIAIIIDLIIKFFINMLIDNEYRVFIEVISNSLFNSIMYLSLIILLIGIILLIIVKFNNKNK